MTPGRARRGGAHLRRRSDTVWTPAAPPTPTPTPTALTPPELTPPSLTPPPGRSPRQLTWPSLLSGAGSALAVNFLLGLLGFASGGSALLGIALVVINLGVIGVALAQRRRGFVASYSVAFALLAGPCFDIARRGLRVG